VAFNYFNLVLSVLVFITVILNFNQALWFALFAGLILDAFLFPVSDARRDFNFGRTNFKLSLQKFFYQSLFIFSGYPWLDRKRSLCFILGCFQFYIFYFGASDNLDKFFSRENIFGLVWQILFGTLFLAAVFLLFNF